MELSPPLRWLAAISVMLVVVVVAGALLINTLGNTFSLSGGASEEPVDELTDQSSQEPSEVADAGSDESDEGDGSGEGDTSGEDDGGSDESSDDEFPQQYTVQSGDTGNDISEQFYGNRDGWSAIAEANDIDPSAPLRVGVELEIPAPE